MVKKQLIIEKSLELFAKQGFDATSVQQITDHCGISKGAFYLSFKSKDELIMAIIDHFMMQFIAKIDYSVRFCESKENMLYEFFYTTLLSFNKSSGLANLFIKEQAIHLNEELFQKLNNYDYRMNQIILFMLHQLYNDEKEDIIYDLLICIRGFIRNYAELSFQYAINMNTRLLAQSLVEKTNILAQHISIPTVSTEMIQRMKSPFNRASFHTNKSPEIAQREQIISLIEQEIPNSDDPIIIESLEILQDTLTNPNPSHAIIKGLLHNIKSNPQCKWIAYLMREYYQL